MIRALSLAAALALAGIAPCLAQDAGPVATTARQITPGTPVPPGRVVVMACGSEGWLRLVMYDGKALDTYVYPGTSQLTGFAVKDVDTAGTTATCRVSVTN